jgi:hypothetical protein
VHAFAAAVCEDAAKGNTSSSSGGGGSSSSSGGGSSSSSGGGGGSGGGGSSDTAGGNHRIDACIGRVAAGADYTIPTVSNVRRARTLWAAAIWHTYSPLRCNAQVVVFRYLSCAAAAETSRKGKWSAALQGVGRTLHFAPNTTHVTLRDSGVGRVRRLYASNCVVCRRSLLLTRTACRTS